MDSITFKCYGKNRTPILGLFSWQNLVLATCFFLRAGVASAWPAAMSTPGRPKRTRKQVERYVPAVVPEAAQDWFRRDPDSHFLPGSGSDSEEPGPAAVKRPKAAPGAAPKAITATPNALAPAPVAQRQCSSQSDMMRSYFGVSRPGVGPAAPAKHLP